MSLEISNFNLSFIQFIHKLPATLQDILVESNVYHKIVRTQKLQLKVNASFHQSQNFTYWNLYMSFQITAHWNHCFLSPVSDPLSLLSLDASGGPQLPEGITLCSHSECLHRAFIHVFSGLPISLSVLPTHLRGLSNAPHSV